MYNATEWCVCFPCLINAYVCRSAHDQFLTPTVTLKCSPQVLPEITQMTSLWVISNLTEFFQRHWRYLTTGWVIYIYWKVLSSRTCVLRELGTVQPFSLVVSLSHQSHVLLCNLATQKYLPFWPPLWKISTTVLTSHFLLLYFHDVILR